MMYTLIDRILFGEHRAAIPLQTAVQYLIRGPRLSSFVFSHGPAKGLRFDCLTSEKYFFERAYFEHAIRLLLESWVKPGWTVYDVGGHIGYWAVVLSRLCGEKGNIYIFEPSPHNFSRLRRNVEVNSLTNVSAFNVAVSDQNGHLAFSDNGSMSRVGAPDSSSVVQAVRLDDFMSNAPSPNLMLVDVEGHGGRVLRGAYGILKSTSPHLVYETHDREEQEEFDGILLSLGYTGKSLENRHGFPRRFHARLGSSS